MAALDQMWVLHLKKIPTLYSVDIEADKICQQRRKTICWIRKIRSSRFASFANFAGKYLCWSLFFNKVACLQLY